MASSSPRLVHFEYPKTSSHAPVSTSTKVCRTKPQQRVWVHPESYINEYYSDSSNEKSWALTALDNLDYNTSSPRDVSYSDDRASYDVTHAYITKRLNELEFMSGPSYHPHIVARLSSGGRSTPRYDEQSSVLFNRLRSSINRLQNMPRCSQQTSYLQRLDEKRKMRSANAYLQYKRGKNDRNILTYTGDYSALLSGVLRSPQIEDYSVPPSNTPNSTPDVYKRHTYLRSREKVNNTKLRAKSAGSVPLTRRHQVIELGDQTKRPESVGTTRTMNSRNMSQLPVLKQDIHVQPKEFCIKIPTADDTESMTTVVESISASYHDTYEE